MFRPLLIQTANSKLRHSFYAYPNGIVFQSGMFCLEGDALHLSLQKTIKLFFFQFFWPNNNNWQVLIWIIVPFFERYRLSTVWAKLFKWPLLGRR